MACSNVGRRGPVHSPGAQAAEHRFENREIRSYESQYVNALWHLDFHHGSFRVLLDRRPMGLSAVAGHRSMTTRGCVAMRNGI